jgi:hypothetical protein
MKKKSKNAKKFMRRSTRGVMPEGAVCDIKLPFPISEPPRVTRRILMRASSILGTDGSGNIKVNIPFDPSATLNATYLSGAVMFPEWTDVAALYAEVKIRQFQVLITPALNGDAKGYNTSPLAIGTNLSAIYVAPTTYNGVLDNGDSQLYPILFDNSGKSRYHAVRFNPGTWALTGSPNPGSSTGISAGCPGYFTLLMLAGPAGVEVGYIKIVAEYIVRSRV